MVRIRKSKLTHKSSKINKFKKKRSIKKMKGGIWNPIINESLVSNHMISDSDFYNINEYETLNELSQDPNNYILIEDIDVDKDVYKDFKTKYGSLPQNYTREEMKAYMINVSNYFANNPDKVKYEINSGILQKKQLEPKEIKQNKHIEKSPFYELDKKERSYWNEKNKTGTEYNYYKFKEPITIYVEDPEDNNFYILKTGKVIFQTGENFTGLGIHRIEGLFLPTRLIIVINTDGFEQPTGEYSRILKSEYHDKMKEKELQASKGSVSNNKLISHSGYEANNENNTENYNNLHPILKKHLHKLSSQPVVNSDQIKKTKTKKRWRFIRNMFGIKNNTVIRQPLLGTQRLNVNGFHTHSNINV